MKKIRLNWISGIKWRIEQLVGKLKDLEKEYDEAVGEEGRGGV